MSTAQLPFKNCYSDFQSVFLFSSCVMSHSITIPFECAHCTVTITLFVCMRVMVAMTLYHHSFRSAGSQSSKWKFFNFRCERTSEWHPNNNGRKKWMNIKEKKNVLYYISKWEKGGLMTQLHGYHKRRPFSSPPSVFARLRDWMCVCLISFSFEMLNWFVAWSARTRCAHQSERIQSMCVCVYVSCFIEIRDWMDE